MQQSRGSNVEVGVQHGWHASRLLLASLVVLAAAGCAFDADRELAPSEVATDAIARVGGLSGTAVWLAAREVEENDVTVALDARLVRGDGSVAWSRRLERDPIVPGGLFIAGPRNGVLAYGTPIDGEMVLRAVDANDESDSEFARVAATVVGADLDPHGEVLYLALSDDQLRIVRVPLDGSEPDELHREPNDDGLVLTWDRLHVTPDGRRLVLDRCAAACSWLVLDLETGGVSEWQPDGAARRVDLSNDTLLASASDCATGPCPFVLLDIATGAAEAWDPNSHLARLGVDERGGTLLLRDDQGAGGGNSVSVTDPTTGLERTVAAVDPNGIALGLAREGQDTWVPAGWELLAPPGTNLGEAGGPTLLRLADGTLLSLPDGR